MQGNLTKVISITYAPQSSLNSFAKAPADFSVLATGFWGKISLPPHCKPISLEPAWCGTARHSTAWSVSPPSPFTAALIPFLPVTNKDFSGGPKMENKIFFRFWRFPAPLPAGTGSPSRTGSLWDLGPKLQQYGLARMSWEQLTWEQQPGSTPTTTGLAATAVPLHGNIPAWGYTSNNNMTFVAAKSDVVRHFPSFPSLYNRESCFLGADNWGNQTLPRVVPKHEQILNQSGIYQKKKCLMM